MNREKLMRDWAPTLGATGTPAPTAQPQPGPPEHTGVMVAFFPSPQEAARLAVAGGEPVDELHLTLAYLGQVGQDVPEDAEPRLIATVTAWASQQEPVSAVVNGIGLFTGGETPVTYANIDAPTLAGARQQLVEQLGSAGVPARTEHGYTPHMTLVYADDTSIRPEPIRMLFSEVVLAFAGNQTRIALGESPQPDEASQDQVVPALAADRIEVSDRPVQVSMNAQIGEAVKSAIEIHHAHDGVTAFVADINGRTLITAPAIATLAAALKAPTLEDITAKHLLWMHGKFVGAEVPNRNGALWSAGDLQMARASVVNGPLNWLHEAKHVIGTLARADYVEASQRADQNPTDLVQPHITADAAIWKWIWPDEAYVVQQASDAGHLWYSMECISKEVSCAGPNGCGNTTSYAQYMAGAACAHVTQRASVRQFVNPIFLGGAVIVPPTRPGWAEADASVMKEAASLAEAAFEQAGQPDVSASEWERVMAQLVRYAGT